MPGGPSLIFDKSSLESLSLDEAVMLDNFYMSNITPLFYIECLADLEKQMRSNSTPDQLVGSLADRTPDAQGSPNVHHLSILEGELSRQFDVATVYERVVLAAGQPVQLGDKNGFIFRKTPEAEAFERWSRREFLTVERDIARRWRRALTAIDLSAMSASVLKELGHWRNPKDLADARQMADIIIDNMDPEWLLRFGLNLLGLPEATEFVVNDWISRRRPPLRQHVPYFIFLLTINIFFALVIPTQLLRNVKPSHQIDLAYLYYLPFCSVFTSKDNFHGQVVPLFLNERQQFVNGMDFKNDLKRLSEYYATFPEDVLKTGLINFAAFPPLDDSYIVARMWDRFLPRWRSMAGQPKKPRDPEEDNRTMEELNRMSDEGLPSHDERDVDKIEYVQLVRNVHPVKGRFLRFSEDQIARMRENQRKKSG